MWEKYTGVKSRTTEYCTHKKQDTKQHEHADTLQAATVVFTINVRRFSYRHTSCSRKSAFARKAPRMCRVDLRQCTSVRLLSVTANGHLWPEYAALCDRVVFRQRESP